jgi:hypothetical protein
MIEDYHHSLYDRAEQVVRIAAVFLRRAVAEAVHTFATLREAAERLDETAE